MKITNSNTSFQRIQSGGNHPPLHKAVNDQRFYPETIYVTQLYEAVAKALAQRGRAGVDSQQNVKVWRSRVLIHSCAIDAKIQPEVRAEGGPAREDRSN
jgi:hypothetical protein